MTHTSHLQIDLGRIDHNVRAWRRLLAASPARRSDRPVGLCAVVKADAYGLGALTLAPHLADAGVDMLAVYNLKQADELVDACDVPLLILMPTGDPVMTSNLAAAARRGQLSFSVDSVAQAAELDRIAFDLGATIGVHLHLDTGLSRAGAASHVIVELAERVAACRHLRITGLYSHFAAADQDEHFTLAQWSRLNAAIAAMGPLLPESAIIHTASTAAATRDRRLHMDMTRIGLGLYGYAPKLTDGAPPVDAITDRLQPAVRWVSKLIHVQRYAAGARVGYGQGFRLERDSIIGLVPAGYGDGYPLTLSNQGVVSLHTAAAHRDATAARPTARVVGRVNMDQITIDLTDAVAMADINVATRVELYSDDPQSPCALPRVAAAAGSSVYELLCRLSPRVPRQYVAAAPMHEAVCGDARQVTKHVQAAPSRFAQV